MTLEVGGVGAPPQQRATPLSIQCLMNRDTETLFDFLLTIILVHLLSIIHPNFFYRILLVDNFCDDDFVPDSIPYHIQ